MTTPITSTANPVLSFVKVGLVIAAFAVMTAPTLSYAATYAYVNTAGNVSTVVANDWQSAIATAPSISLHSGVLLLDSIDDTNVVGDGVGGV